MDNKVVVSIDLIYVDSNNHDWYNYLFLFDVVYIVKDRVKIIVKEISFLGSNDIVYVFCDLEVFHFELMDHYDYDLDFFNLDYYNFICIGVSQDDVHVVGKDIIEQTED